MTARDVSPESTFRIERVRESIETFHHRELEAGGRRLWLPHLDPKRTLVLGSAQRPDTVDADRAGALGIELVRRRSGGGAVMVSAHDCLWVDVVIDRGDPLWTNDVGRAFLFVGHAVQRSLAAVGVHTFMHNGTLQRSAWSDRVCFAGLGPGELVVRGGGKCVGISQRRNRSAARFQVAILRRWEPELFASLVVQPDGADPSELTTCATPLDIDEEAVIDAMTDHLSGSHADFVTSSPTTPGTP